MTILQIITPSRIAGAERSSLSLFEHLSRAGFRVVVGCKAGSPFLDLARGQGLEAHALGIHGKVNPLAPFRIAALARQVNAAVIHTQLSSAAWHGVMAARLLGIPSVAHVRALNSATVYRRATRIIAVSDAVRRHLTAQAVDPGKIDVVYNGIDPARYYSPCSREEARAQLGLPPEAVIVGVVAHFSPRKGHSVFVDAFARVAERCPHAIAILLGEGDTASLREQLARLGIADRVVFPGFTSDVLPYYTAMDIVALPAVSGEGLPRTLLEGGLLGLPCVGSDLSGIPEIIEHQRTGYIVPPGDATALADRLIELAEDADLRRRMGELATTRVASTFTVSAMVEGTLQSYARAGVRLPGSAVAEHPAL